MIRNTEVLGGLRSGLIPSISVATFGILFGAVSVTQGQTIFETALMSLTIFAGASQLVGVELFGQRVSAWIIVLSIVAVNFRHVLYSAALTPVIAHFSLLKKIIAFFLMTDPQFAEALKRHEHGTPVSFAWYLGVGLCLYGMWNIMTLVGATLGGFIDDPKALGLDILLPIYFLSLVMGFRHRPNYLPIVAVSAIGSILAYITIGSPWHVSIGALGSIALAAILPPKSNKNAHMKARTS